MIIKVNSKEYSIDGYVNPINSVQKLAEEIYQQGRADAIDEFIKNVLTELNGIAEDNDYTFSKDNADLVSSVLYGQQFVTEKEQNND